MTSVDSFLEYLKPLSQRDQLSFDFYVVESQANKISYENKKLKNNSFSSSQNFCLRLMKDGKSASSYTKDFSKQSIEECYEVALKSLTLSDNEKAGDLSKSQKYTDLSHVYNSKPFAMDLLKKIDKVKDMDQALLSTSEKVMPIANVLMDGESHCAFANSEGEKAHFSDNYVAAYSYCLAVDGEKRASAFSQDYGRNYEDIDFKKLGEESASKCLKKLNFIIPKTGSYDIVFDCESVVPTLLSLLLGHLNACNIYDKQSLFQVKDLNQKKFSDQLFLMDDPFAEWGLSISPFDGEGFCSKKITLVENGQIKNYLSDSFSARALGIDHTAKASRSEDGSVQAGSTNIIMKKGEHSLEEFKKTSEQFIMIDGLKSLAGYNGISGDFSIEAEGFLWEKGEATPISQFTVSGNLISVFRDISKIFNDEYISNGSIKSSSFLVPHLSIAGK